MFAVWQVCEKFVANGKDVFEAFMDFEKAHDKIDRHGMWQMLRVYGVGGKLLKSLQFLFIDSRVCVLVGNALSCSSLVVLGQKVWSISSKTLA